MSENRRDFGPVQLARWLGIEEWQLRRAQNRGLIPPPDVQENRWSQTLAMTLPDRVGEILAAVGTEREPASQPPAETKPKSTRERRAEGFGPIQLGRYLGLKNWQVKRARERGLIPEPDTEHHRWSEELAKTLPDKVEEILAVVGDHPGLGSEKAAEHLAQRTGLDIDRSDVQLLAERGYLRPVGDFRGWPLYATEGLDVLAHSVVAGVVQERQAWLESSVTSEEAAELLSWSVGRFEVTAERRGLSPGRFGRFAREDISRLTEDSHR
ncbi:hypothetical protein [Streptomyces sp. NPDC018833]|uniref:hypothetical protein n=1 Tax=Streptomyces sp. NPDC018833 TaxID=3365053 RepID=UPI00378898A5